MLCNTWYNQNILFIEQFHHYSIISIMINIIVLFLYWRKGKIDRYHVITLFIENKQILLSLIVLLIFFLLAINYKTKSSVLSILNISSIWSFTFLWWLFAIFFVSSIKLANWSFLFVDYLSSIEMLLLISDIENNNNSVADYL